ncbi:MAG: MaoC/PaaZ C-terminal domain-containing protein [Pseudomonadota bacterium]
MNPDIANLAPGQKWILKFSVSADEQEAFALLSGDLNPIHLNQAFAEQAGFQRPVVYGGMLIAKLSSIIGMYVPGSRGLWSGVKIDFRSPLLVDQEAKLEVELIQFSEAVKSYVLNVLITCQGEIIASGKAMATLL